MSHPSSTNRRELCPISTRQPAVQEKGTDSSCWQPTWNLMKILTSFFAFRSPVAIFLVSWMLSLEKGKVSEDRSGDMKRNESVPRWKSPSPGVKAGMCRSPTPRGSVSQKSPAQCNSHPEPWERGSEWQSTLKYSPNSGQGMKPMSPQQRNKGLSLTLWAGIKRYWSLGAYGRAPEFRGNLCPHE